MMDNRIFHKIWIYHQTHRDTLNLPRKRCFQMPSTTQMQSKQRVTEQIQSVHSFAVSSSSPLTLKSVAKVRARYGHTQNQSCDYAYQQSDYEFLYTHTVSSFRALKASITSRRLSTLSSCLRSSDISNDIRMSSIARMADSIHLTANSTT